MRFDDILCPIDFSRSSKAAAELAMRLVGRGGTVHLLHVLEPAYVVSPFDAMPVLRFPLPNPRRELAAIERARRRLEALGRTLRRRSAPFAVRAHVTSGGGPEAEILRAARAQHADAIVMGTAGRSGIAKMLLGSVAAVVVSRSLVPVVVVRPRGVPRASRGSRSRRGGARR